MAFCLCDGGKVIHSHYRYYKLLTHINLYNAIMPHLHQSINMELQNAVQVLWHFQVGQSALTVHKGWLQEIFCQYWQFNILLTSTIQTPAGYLWDILINNAVIYSELNVYHTLLVNHVIHSIALLQMCRLGVIHALYKINAVPATLSQKIFLGINNALFWDCS